MGIEFIPLGIPRSLRPTFQEYNLERLDPDRDAFTVVEKVLTMLMPGRRLVSLVCAIALSFISISCSPAPPLPADTSQPVPVPSTQAPLPSPTLFRTRQPTPTHYWSTRTPLPTATRTPLLTVTPRPTHLPTPSAYTLPSWLADPAVPVVAAVMGIFPPAFPLAFINLSTGERFDMPVADIFGYFWTPDGRTFGLLALDKQTVYLIDLASGSVTYHSLDDRALRFLPDMGYFSVPFPLVASTSSPEDPSFVLLHRQPSHYMLYSSIVLSADRAYVAWEDLNRGYIQTEELATGRVITVTDPVDDVFDHKFFWSPTDYRLAVLQGISETVPFLFNADRITIYDAATGETLTTYSGAFERLEWAPDGNRLLYRDRAGDYLREVPCVLDLATGERNCLSTMAATYPEGSAYATLYGWAPDGRSITYIHCDNGLPQQGGFCFFDLQTGSSFCPTQGLPEMQGRAVRGYDISPDGQYVALLTDTMCPSDDTGPSGALVVKQDGSWYYSLWQPDPMGETTVDPPFQFLWRPGP